MPTPEMTPTPRTDDLIRKVTAGMNEPDSTEIKWLIEHARTLERSLARLVAQLERYEQALQRIAITDDGDCAHSRDPITMTRIARAALAGKEERNG